MRITKEQRKQFIDAIHATDEPLVETMKSGSRYIRVYINKSVWLECYVSARKSVTPRITIEMGKEKYSDRWADLDGWNGRLVRGAFYNKYKHIINGSPGRLSDKEALQLLLEKKSV